MDTKDMININVTWSDGKRLKGIQLAVTNRNLKNARYRELLGENIMDSVFKNSGVYLDGVFGVREKKPRVKKGEYGNPKKI